MAAILPDGNAAMDRKTLALMVMLFPAAAFAGDPPAAAAEAAADPDDAVVCRSERNAGTRFEKKTCRTKSEWARIAKAAEEDFGKARNRPVTCPDCRD